MSHDSRPVEFGGHWFNRLRLTRGPPGGRPPPPTGVRGGGVKQVLLQYLRYLLHFLFEYRAAELQYVSPLLRVRS